MKWNIIYYNSSKTLLEEMCLLLPLIVPQPQDDFFLELSKSKQWNVLFCKSCASIMFPTEICQSFTSIPCLQPAAYLYHLTIDSVDTRITYIMMNLRESSAMALKIALKP